MLPPREDRGRARGQQRETCARAQHQSRPRPVGRGEGERASGRRSLIDDIALHAAERGQQLVFLALADLELVEALDQPSLRRACACRMC
jgi:hypothetical protein